MYKPVKYITKVPYKDFCTYYLYCVSNKTLLPIEVENQKIKKYHIPSIYNSIKRILNALRYPALRVSIYHARDGIFYSYLTIKKGKCSLDINVDFEDSIEISRELSVPIYVRDKVISEYGIEVTKDLISKALKN